MSLNTVEAPDLESITVNLMWNCSHLSNPNGLQHNWKNTKTKHQKEQKAKKIQWHKACHISIRTKMQNKKQHKVFRVAHFEDDEDRP